jgi:hypothetical protein
MWGCSTAAMIRAANECWTSSFVKASLVTNATKH